MGGPCCGGSVAPKVSVPAVRRGRDSWGTGLAGLLVAAVSGLPFLQSPCGDRKCLSWAPSLLACPSSGEVQGGGRFLPPAPWPAHTLTLQLFLCPVQPPPRWPALTPISCTFPGCSLFLHRFPLSLSPTAFSLSLCFSRVSVSVFSACLCISLCFSPSLLSSIHNSLSRSVSLSLTRADTHPLLPGPSGSLTFPHVSSSPIPLPTPPPPASSPSSLLRAR